MNEQLPVARLQVEVSDRPHTEGESYFDIVILERERCADGMLLYAAAPAVVQAEVSEAQVSAAARVLADRSAEACNVDKDDSWKVYGQDFIDDARAALISARGAA